MASDFNHDNTTPGSQYQKMFHCFVENLHDGISLADPEGTVILWNHGMEKITGLKKDRAIGAKIWDLFLLLRAGEERPGRLGKQLRAVVRRILAQQGQGESVRERRYIRRADGTQRYVESLWTPLYHQDIWMVGCFTRDITEGQQLYAKMSAQKDRTETLLRITSQFNSNLNLPDILTTACREVTHLFKAKMASVCLFDHTRQEISQMAGYGLPAGFNSNLPLIPPKYYPRAGMRQTVVQIRNVQRCQGLAHAALLKELKIRNVIITGIAYKGTLLGMLIIYRQGTWGALHQEDIDFLSSLSFKTGLTIFNAQLFQREKLLRKQLQQLNGRIFNAQEEERRRISRELHDGTGQALTALKFNLNLLQNRINARYGSEPGLDQALELVNSIFQQIHFLTRDLRPPALEEMGIHLIFEDYCGNFMRRTGITVQYEGVPIPGLSDQISICLYRLLQESLTNIIKHAAAQNVRVRLDKVDHCIEFCVSDDGRGFPAAEIIDSKTKGIGIIGMRERVEMLNGEFSIDSVSGQGTTVLAVVPWEDS